MQIRILAGCKRLMMALAIASLIIAPAGAAAPMSQGQPASGTPLNSGNPGQQVDDQPAASQPILYSRSNYSWPFSSGPVYATVDASELGRRRRGPHRGRVVRSDARFAESPG